MITKESTLIAEFKDKGWQVQQLYKRIFDLCANSEDIFSFCKLFLVEFEKGATIFDDSLSYVSEKQFAELIVLALAILKDKDNENAAEVIHYASLQFPELLHQHLELIFELKPNESSYYSDFPWRYLSSDSLAYYKERLVNPTSEKSEKQKLFNCLLETRDIKALQFAMQYAQETKLFDTAYYLIASLEEVGFTMRNGKIERYCSDTVKHFCFPSNYFSINNPIQINKKQHPTWNLISKKNQYAFGGEINEDSAFTHVVTLDSLILNTIGITGLEHLTLGVHINELNENGIVFYQHNTDGTPQVIGELLNDIELSESPIKATQILLADTPKRWRNQSWGSANGRENLFRFGGEPTWIQGASVLTCPICTEKMSFILQLDNDLPNIKNSEVYFGSGGMCYAFWCNKDKVSGYIMQCT